jgi:signal transduction histidine kinase/DNA-binding response OmpR family regulator
VSKEPTVPDPVDILVADDHPENIFALEGILSRPDYRLIKCTSGAEALKAVLKHDLALILLDVMMPRMDGFETASLIRARDASRHIPIVFLTANASDVSFIYKAYAVGGADYLIKPIEPDVVRAKVAVFVELHRKNRQIRRQEEQLREAERLRGEAALRAERAQTEERHRFLANASEILLSTLEHRDTLERVARLAVPAIADWCVLDVGGENIQLGREIAVAADSPERGEVVADLRRRLVAGEDQELVRLFRASTPELSSSVEDGTLAERVHDPATLGLLAAAGCSSFLRVPLIAHGRSLGTITLASAKPNRFTASDLDIATDLAHRIAFALDNARLYQEARAAVAIREEFLSIASHELRTPLTSLMLQFQRLQRLGQRGESEALPPKIQDGLAKCDRQTRVLAQLIESLLDVSRISAGALELETKDFDLAEVVSDVVARLGEQATSAGCTIELQSEPSVVGRWDRTRIEQLVTNLVSNAIKYGRGKPVHIGLELTDRGARLMVRDEGIGIEEESLQRIFDRFERAAPNAFGGLGLGLYIARQIASAHGGEIRVSSRPGHGATFTVELPLDLGDDARETGPAVRVAAR